RVGEARNFANKLWNVARYAEDKIGDQHNLRAQAEPQAIADHWILNKLSISASEMSKYLEGYRLSEAYETLYHFVWDELADWYVEASKTDANPTFLAYILESTLKLAHPFAPFVTETIWQTLAWEQDSILAVQRWPQPADQSLPACLPAAQFEEIRTIVSEVRRISSALGLNKPKLYYRNAPAVAENTKLVAQLAGLGEIIQNDSPVGLRLTTAAGECWLDVDKETAKDYLLKLERQKLAHQSTVQALEGRLANKSYIDKAPKELVEESRSQLEAEKTQLTKIEEDLAAFTKHLE
ncbi:MAG TPA: class I tRNA ligase family protein, partial [Candidatus Saccharimonadales bacterium]|nr:class I tRNA ligase family protein [Candidatus Saccharimonadales bacterium]